MLNPNPLPQSQALEGLSILNLMLGAEAGGLEAMALNTHRALVVCGAKVRSVGAPDGWFARAVLQEAGQFSALPIWTRFDPTAASRLRGLPRDAGPGLIVAHGSRAVTLAVSAYRGRAPIAAVVHNFRAKADLARVDLAICVSPAVERDVHNRFPGLAATVVENFARLVAGPPRAPREGPPRIGAIGRLHRNKGYDVLLQASALLRDRGVDFHLTIAGDGPEAGALRMEAEVLGLNRQVSFPGWVAAPDALFAETDLFVLSSTIEPFGLVVIEAMAQGVPVIASDIDGPRTILEGGRFGRLVTSGQPEALAQAVVDLLSDPQSAQETARQAQAHALAHYSLEAGAARLAVALDPLIRPALGSGQPATS